MKLISTQENLKRGLSVVCHITSKNINLPILNNILIRASEGSIEFVSTNLEIGIINKVRGKVEKTGEFTVDAKIINEYIGLLPSSEKVKIEEKDGELKVECDNYKTKIKGESSSEFPLIPSIEKSNGFSCKIDDFKKALSSVSFAVSGNENRVELSGVLFVFAANSLTMVATDSYRLAEKNIKINSAKNSGEEQRVIVPARTINEVFRILNGLGDYLPGEDSGEINFYLSENQILFSLESTDIISRLISGNYPDYKQIIPNKTQTTILVDRPGLLRAVKAAALFSKTGINDVALEFKDGRIIISASSGLSGESRVELETDISGDDNEIIINYKYLVDGLNNISGDKVFLEIVNSGTPCLIKPEKGDDYLYIVMPIRQ